MSITANQFFVIFVSCFYYRIILVYSSECACPSKPIKFTLNATSNDFKLEREIIDGVDLGFPILFGGNYYLTTKYKLEPAVSKLGDPCPKGYSLPTREDLNKIVSMENNTDGYSKALNQLGLNPGDYYLSSNKTYPDNFISSTGEAWTFDALTISKSTNKFQIRGKSSYFGQSYNFAICKMSSAQIALAHPIRDMIINEEYMMEVTNNNIREVHWSFTELTDKKVPIRFSEPGCHVIQLYALNAANNSIYDCRIVFSIIEFGSDADTSLSPSEITSEVIPNVKAQFVKNIGFNRASTAVAPNIDGGVYVVFTDLEDNLRVLEFDQNLQQVNDFLAIRNSRSMDIVATEYGFVVYARDATDSNNAYITGFNKDGTQRFNTVIMNNGDDPTQVRQQVSFFENILGSVVPLYGTEVMHSAHNGKLVYGKDQIGLIFAHYNHFGFIDGERNDHTGDTFFTFTKEGASKGYAWGWQTSHSAYQAAYYDNEFFVTASLGDLYPENINVCFIDPISLTDTIDPIRKARVKNPYRCKDIVPGKIPGNGLGRICGRLGGIHRLGYTFAITYARNPCRMTGYFGDVTESYVDEIAVVTFKFDRADFSEIQTHVVGKGEKVIGLRSGQYGNKILILHSNMFETKKELDPTRVYYSQFDKMNMTFVGFDGKIYMESTEHDKFIIPVNGDMKFLRDGRLVWANVDQLSNSLILSSTPRPEYVTTKDSFIEVKLKGDLGGLFSYDLIVSESFDEGSLINEIRFGLFSSEVPLNDTSLEDSLGQYLIPSIFWLIIFLSL